MSLAELPAHGYVRVQDVSASRHVRILLDNLDGHRDGSGRTGEDHAIEVPVEGGRGEAVGLCRHRKLIRLAPDVELLILLGAGEERRGFGITGANEHPIA